MQKQYESFNRIIDEERIAYDEPMAKHTTFRIGGNADVFAKPNSEEELKRILAWCKTHEVPYYIIGNGSNLLVADAGIRGVVIAIGSDMSKTWWEGDSIYAEAGCMLSRVAGLALERGLTGMEFAAGIPGSVGGAVRMNAGAYGGEMKDILHTVTLLQEDGTILKVPAAELNLGYRTSRITGSGEIVLRASFTLAKGDPDAIRGRMKELGEARREKQPLEYPSAGSTFKRPEGHYAGKLIMDAGLAGFRVGDALVSEKHCGFVINAGQAKAEDVRTLIREVQARVKDRFDVDLEPEIRMIGEF